MSEPRIGAAIISFAAAGAIFMAATLLLLFNPGSRALRWYALFATSLIVWLAMQGAFLLQLLDPWWWRVYGANVHLMPALFFASRIADQQPRRAWLPVLPVVAGAALLPVIGDPMDTPLSLAWHVAAWGTPGLLYLRDAHKPRTSLGARLLGTMLGFGVPVIVLGSIVLRSDFVLYVLPVLTVLIHFLVFIGVVHHRYYEIEVRAARGGELAAAAAEQDRLALLGEIAATVAHEVRNPLTGIRSLTQQLAEAPPDDERRSRYTAVILDEIARLDRIVGNLTDLARRNSRLGAGGGGATSLATLFEDLAMLVEPRARRRNVRVLAETADCAVRAPREALAQALLNLLLNAIAHAPEHTAVRLSAARDAEGGVAIRVRDHGPGIPSDRRADIFEPFSTSGGTGLGLAVVRRLAAEHGWRVEVDDAPGGGAEFRMTLRAADAEPAKRLEDRAAVARGAS